VDNFPEGQGHHSQTIRAKGRAEQEDALRKDTEPDQPQRHARQYEIEARRSVIRLGAPKTLAERVKPLPGAF
jgi:hypothetical protein